ncbi:MAG: serine/threonine-protein kinase [Myxococcota bacterium]
MSSESQKPKTVSFGDYTVTGRLGEGGMCHVFRARKKGDSNDCALKLLKEDQRADERVLDLFVTEADLSLLLHHPNLVETYDAGEVNGRYYIAMELIEGANLKEIITECERIGVELPPDLGMFIVSEMLEGLEAVHNATGHSGAALGLVHRDVTPHNIFVSFDGRVILGDLGIAHITAYGEAEVGTAIGKIGYLSPEQACAEPIDARSDLFSSGVILFELLTNQRLYEGENEQQVIADIAEGKVPKLRKLRPSVSRGVEAMMKKALARKPKDRFGNAEEMVLALEPHWSPQIANPKVLAGLMAALFKDRAREFKERRTRGRTLSEVSRPIGPL